MDGSWNGRRVAAALGVAGLVLLLLAMATYPGAFASRPLGTPTPTGWSAPVAVQAAPAETAALVFQTHLVFDTTTHELRSPGTAGYFATWWRPGTDEVITVAGRRLALYDAGNATLRISSTILDPAFGSWSPDGAAFVAEGDAGGARRTYLVDAASGSARQVGKVDYVSPWSPDGAWLGTLDGSGARVVFERVHAGGHLAVDIAHLGNSAGVRWAGPSTAVVVVEDAGPTAYVVDVREDHAAIAGIVSLEKGAVAAGPNGEVAVIQDSRALLYRPAVGARPVSVAAKSNLSYRVALWSPDGSQVAIRDGRDLLVVESETGRILRRIGYTVAERWEPDGALTAWVWPCQEKSGYVRIRPDGALEASRFDTDALPSPDTRWIAARSADRLRVHRAPGGGAPVLEVVYPGGFSAIGWSGDSRYLSFRTGPIESGGPCVGAGPLGP